MQPLIVALFALFAVIAAVAVQAVGNGQTTNAMSFGGFPGPYTYERALSVNWNNGSPTCPLGMVSTDDGPLAPLTGESHHIFRGPLNLLQFAVYQIPGGPSNVVKKRSAEPMIQNHRHLHAAKKRIHRHLRREQLNKEKRQYGAEVTATIDGQVVTLSDTWDTPVETVTNEAPHPSVGPAAAGSVPVLSEDSSGGIEATSPFVPIANTVLNSIVTSATAVTGLILSEDSTGGIENTTPFIPISTFSSAPQPPAPPPPSTAPQSPFRTPAAAPTGSGSWSRIAYFNAASQISENIAFTANNAWVK